MCPEQQLLSVYLDGELPSPWKEKMETHLADCSRCRERLENWRGLFAEQTPEADLANAQERIWRNLEPRLRSGAPGRVYTRHRGGYGLRRFADVLGRRVSIPLPAAAAAAAVILFALAALWLRKPVAPPLPNMIAVSEEDLTPPMPVSDMNGVLQYLGAAGSGEGEILILRLPESRSFISSGEPAIIRAADYSRNAAVRRQP